MARTRPQSATRSAVPTAYDIGVGLPANKVLDVETPCVDDAAGRNVHRMFFRHIVNAGFWADTAKGGEYFLDRYNPGDAKIRFDVVLDRVTGSDPSVTDYVLEQPAEYPNCKREILGKTLVEPV